MYWDRENNTAYIALFSNKQIADILYVSDKPVNLLRSKEPPSLFKKTLNYKFRINFREMVTKNISEFLKLANY